MVHDQYKYQCNQCNYKTSRRDYLQSHRNIIHDKQQSSIKDFIKNIRSEEERHPNKNDNGIMLDQENTAENDDQIFSTQNMIEDARARRQYGVKEFNCEQCEFKSSSKTLMHNHIRNSHESENKCDNDEEKVENTNQNKLNIRKRFSCETCAFKTTNENLLKRHNNTIHENENQNYKMLKTKSKSKRIHCDICDKKKSNYWLWVFFNFILT